MAMIAKPVKFPEEMISAVENWSPVQMGLEGYELTEKEGFSAQLKNIIAYTLFYRDDIQKQIDELKVQKVALGVECDQLTDIIRDTKSKATKLLKSIGDLSYDVDARRNRW